MIDDKQFAQIIANQIKGRDLREKKPLLVFNESDFTKHLTLSTSWILTIDRYQIHLIQPNDIALYANITESALKKARAFYSEQPEWYMTRQAGGLIPVLPDTEVLYMDYFEAIIQAVIFSFTCLETFSNICLPDGYIYEDAAGKTYGKVAIERFKPLDFKFEFILTDLLQTPDPKQETWWTVYEQLKEIRDRIIHSKPSTAEERYSLLLHPTIFETIGCYRTILSYYGSYIKANFQELLDEFPYGFGFDEIAIKTITNASYLHWIEAMHNPWRPPK